MGWFEKMNWQEDTDPELEQCISCQKVLVRGKEHTFCKKCDKDPVYAQDSWESMEFADIWARSIEPAA